MVGGATTPGSTTSAGSSTSKGSKRARLNARLSGSRHSQKGDPFDDDYPNPLQDVPRWRLTAQAMALRAGASVAFTMGNRATPVPPAQSQTLWLDSTLSEWKGKAVIRVDVWQPGAVHQEPLQPPAAGGDFAATEQATPTPMTESAPSPTEKRPAVINFHGGGFLLGDGTDDTRWAASAVGTLNAVVFSVNYRLAPGYPYPTPPEDALDAVVQICARADEFAIDTSRVLLSGFSSGGTLALTSWVVLQDPTRWGYELPTLENPISIAGLVLFYPLLDWTIPRDVKRQLCVRPDQTLPPGMTNLFDASYIHPPIPHSDRDDPRLSPGLMPPEMMARLPPVHLCLCEWDMLLTEGLKFAERLRDVHRTVTCRVVLGEKHAWDKPPPFTPQTSVEAEYKAALVAMRHWLREDGTEATRKDVSRVNDSTHVESQ